MNARTGTGLSSAAGALLLAASAFLLVPLYTGNPALGFAWETASAGLAAHSLAREGDLSVREYFPAASRGDTIGYALRWRDDGLYSIEPLASILTFTPFFVPHRATWPLARKPDPVHNLVAAQIATLTLIAMGLWLANVASLPRALLVVGIIALATPHRTIVASGLWQHTSGTLWLTLGLLAFGLAPRRRWLYPVAGAALALATACRPVLVPASLLLVLAATRDARGRPGPAVASAAIVAALGGVALFANWTLHGSLLGGRVDFVGSPERFADVSSYFSFSPVHWAGLLVSPNRGLFVFSPVLLFALPGLVRSLRADAPPTHRWISLSGLAIFGLYGFIATWWAGSVYGPRYMTDLLPFFAFWMARTPLPQRGRAVLGALFATAVLASAAVQSVGARAYPCGWNAFPAELDRAPERVWSWRDTQIRRCARRALRIGAAETPEG